MTRISWTNNVLIPSINHTKATQKNNANKMNVKKTHEDVKERERESESAEKNLQTSSQMNVCSVQLSKLHDIMSSKTYVVFNLND